jgi:putative transposase
VFNVIDDSNTDGLAIDVDFSLTASQVITVLDQVIEWRGKPCRIRCDNAPQYLSNLLTGPEQRYKVGIDTARKISAKWMR